MQRLCDDEVRLRQAEHSGQLRKAVGAYSIGVRTTDIVDTLATCHVWATNIGQWIPCPVGFDRSTWTDTLDSLVVERLGDHRCLDCGDFFLAAEHTRIGLHPLRPGQEGESVRIYEGRFYAHRCPHCRSTATEPIQCTEGVTR